MSENRESILSQLDELKSSISQALDQVEKLENESEELRSARREAEEKAWALEEEVKNLTQELTSLKQKHDETDAKLKSMEEEVDSLKSRADEAESTKDEAVAELTKERDELRAEMDEITGKLERVSELYREASVEKEKLQEKVDVSDLLSIYIMLLETVFFGKPHARILYMLHDTKAPITRKNIAQSSGIQPMVVQKAIYDLANSDLVSYNEETQEVTLIKAIL